MVITALTRNQVVSQEARGFESHPVRHNAGTISMIIMLMVPSFLLETSKKRLLLSKNGIAIQQKLC